MPNEGATLLGHTVFSGGVTEACSRAHISEREASPHSSESKRPESLDIGLQVYSRGIVWSLIIRVFFGLGLLALLQLHDTVSQLLPEGFIEALDGILNQFMQ
jgi:hypothetical protein